jgi:hypothetical protein
LDIIEFPEPMRQDIGKTMIYALTIDFPLEENFVYQFIANDGNPPLPSQNKLSRLGK